MKKTLYSALVMLMTAFTFTSCEDVPMPYDDPNNNNNSDDPTVVVEPSGDGTLENPFNSVAANNKAAELADKTASSEKYYIKGKVVSIKYNYGDGNYPGTADYYISDDGTSNGQFYVYASKYLGDVSYTSGDVLKEGDEVIVYGNLYNYGGTYETATNSSYLYSLNGTTAGGGGTTAEPSGDGTLSNPFNSVAANNKAAELADKTASSEKYYIKGKVASIRYNYGDGNYPGTADYYISDDGTSNGQFYVYASKYLGDVSYTSGDVLKEGDEVIVYGNLYNYGGTYETATNKSYLYSLNGKTGGETPDTPSGEAKGDGTESNPYNVTAALNKEGTKNVYVKAYIVGFIDGKSSSDAKFGTTSGETKTNILISDKSDATSIDDCMPVQLPSGAVRNGLNLVENPSNLKKEVLLYGEITKYFSIMGVKSVTYAKIGDTEYGTKPSGGGGTSSEILNETFASGVGSFTIKDVTLGTGASYVWSHASNYSCMKASAYVSGANIACESWLVSPALDLSKVSDANITFDHALNYLNGNTVTDYINVMVSTDYSGDVSKATWTALTVSPTIAGSSWTFESATASMKSFAGKSGVYVAFKYVSTSSVAPTWEVKNVVIK